MLKVLHVLSDSNIGGAGTYVATYIKNCDRSTIEPAVLLPRGSDAVRILKDTGCNIIEADITPDKSFDIKAIPVIRRVIRSGKYDLVHAHGCASARFAAKGVCKSVFTKHTISSHAGGIKGVLSKILYRLTGGTAIAVSEASADNLVRLGFNRKHIYTVMNGAEDMGIADADVRAVSKASFGIDASKYVVGCLARFSKEKDYATLLTAAAKSAAECDRLAFLLCGDGSELSGIKLLAKELGIYSKCVFTGTVFDAERAYHAMNLYCIASLHESFGLSLAEAWSAGLPSITSNADGFAEISENGVTSLMFEKGDSDKLAEYILMLYNDSDMSQRIAEGGTARYRERYGAAAFARGIERVYKSVCNRA